MKKIIVFAYIFISCLYAVGQQLPIHNQFFINPFIYNPAFAGDHNSAVLYLTHRQQWMGIEGAPITSTVSIHSPVGDKLALGLNVVQDKAGILTTSSALATFGYKVPFSSTHFIRFGLSAGIGMNNLDLEDAYLDDPVLVDVLDKNTFLDGKFGINYHISGFNFGFALPRLVETPFLSTDEFNSKIDIHRLKRYLFTASYKFGNPKSVISFEPTVLYSMSDGIPNQYEVYGIFYLGKSVWVGGSYRQDYGPTGYFGLKIKDSFNFGYAYELSSDQVSAFTDGTHEIQLGFRLTKPKKPVKKPVTRPVPKTNITAQNQTPQVKKEEQKVVEEKPAQVVEQKVVQEKPAQIVEQKKTEIVQQKPIQQTKPEQKTEKSEKWEVLSENKPIVTKETPKEEKAQPKVEEKKPVERLPAEEKQVIVKKGKHPLELDEGNYVVVGAFSIYENAERYKDQLFKEGFFSKFGYTTEKNYYYVYLFVSGTLQNAKKERDRLQKMSEFDDAWILTVE